MTQYYHQIFGSEERAILYESLDHGRIDSCIRILQSDLFVLLYRILDPIQETIKDI